MREDVDISALVGAYPTCGACGGRNVRCDAWAGWNALTCGWEIAATFDAAHCPDCDARCDILWRVDTDFRKKRIRRLNDLVRHGDLCRATVVVTEGVRAWGEAFLRDVAEAVIAFDTFGDDNDPHCEHDFGAFEVQGRKLVWKIDCFDLALAAQSPDPANPEATHRVLTIMLASEH